MARKPVLTGGRKDEIIDVATRLFFINGYEATSVRMIMDEVGGEIGMFYHYFKSKDMLFDQVVERFFQNYRKKFETVLTECENKEQLVEKLVPLYERSMTEFNSIKDNIHWTVQIALHEGTLRALCPAVSGAISKWDIGNDTPPDVLAGQLIYGISATVHSEGFEKLSHDDKKKCIVSFIDRVFGM